jgi:hypothetical protein
MRSLYDVQNKIDVADQAGRNASFKWYVEIISEMMKTQAAKEGNKNGFARGKTDDFPISCMLQHIALKYNIINQQDEDKYTIEVFKSALSFFQEHKNKLKAMS